MLRIFALTILAIFTGAAGAHNAPVDEIGCHTDPSSGAYHCLAGPLAGLEFVSKEEAMAAFNQRTKEDDESIAPARKDVSERLNLVTWRMRKSPTKVDFDRIASILATADMAILQNVEFNEHGDTPLLVVASLLERRLNEKICKGWFKNAKGQRGHYAFIWRESVAGFVEPSGELRETCSTHPWVIRSDLKDPGVAAFYLKSTHKLFMLSTTAFDKAPKRPESELPRLFRAFADTSWAVIFAGDLRTSPRSAAFKEMRKWNFKSALASAVKSKRGGYDNFWFKNISLITAAPVNLYEQFPEIAAKDVDNTVSDNFPVRAEFSFSEKEADSIQTEMISKKKGKGSASTKGPVLARFPAYAPPLQPGQLSDLKEDLESEERAADIPGLKKRPVKKKPAKKKKSK